MDKKLRRNIPSRAVGASNLTGAGALVYCRNTKRYLFLLRNGDRHDGSWGLVGGKVEDNETPVEGLYREIEEEISLSLRSQKIIPIEKFTSESKKFVYHTYVITVESEFIPVLNHEHRGYAWVSLNDHPTPLHPGVWRTFKFDAVVDKLRTLESVL